MSTMNIQNQSCIYDDFMREFPNRTYLKIFQMIIYIINAVHITIYLIWLIKDLIKVFPKSSSISL